VSPAFRISARGLASADEAQRDPPAAEEIRRARRFFAAYGRRRRTVTQEWISCGLAVAAARRMGGPVSNEALIAAAIELGLPVKQSVFNERDALLGVEVEDV